uniref:Uncharacterized protein n=1 Tax=Oncorhynchus tshawytscha TaxID=74940 RepID=A0A8C8LTH9_ONCTS
MNHSGPEKREQKFVLDCIAVSSIALGYEHIVPQKTTPSVRRVPQKTENKELKSAAAQKSLDLRNTSGAGHSREQVSNHSGLMSDNKPLIGYNGRFGFRRNTPNLRRNPSSFGEVTTFQLH